MHIAEGVLPWPVLAGGAAMAALGTAMGLSKLDSDKVPKVGLFSGVLFVASLVHVPIGPSSAHLILNGLAGMLLGWCVFPALLVALGLQAILFQFGGLTSLGMNTFNLAMPGVLAGMLFRGMVRTKRASALRCCADSGIAGACCAMSVCAVVMCWHALFKRSDMVFVSWKPVILAGAVGLVGAAAAGPWLRDRMALVAGFAAGSGAVFLSAVITAFTLAAAGKGFLVAARLLVAGHIGIMLVEGLITGFCVAFIVRVKPEMLEERTKG